MWRVDADGKTMLPGGKPRPCKPIPMKNLEDIVKGISGFIQYWESLNIADVGGSCWHRYGSWIQYWTRVCAALVGLHQDTPLTLKHGFWPQTRVDVQAMEASLLGMKRFVRSLMWTTITLALLVTVPHHLSALQWIVMKAICSFASWR